MNHEIIRDMKTEIENIIYNYTDEILHILIRVINA